MEILLLQVHKKKLRGVIRDSELKFDSHITESCLKVSEVRSALCRISNFMSTETEHL